MDEKLKNVVENQFDFENELLKEVNKQLENETKEIVEFDKEKEQMKDGIMKKIIGFIIKPLLKNLKFELNIYYNDKVIIHYIFPKN